MRQPPHDHVCVTKQQSEAAAAARVAVRLAARERAELLGLIQPAFRRTGPWLQAGKYVAALMSDLPRRNGWTIARCAGDRSPDRTQRLLNRAAWDERAAMSAVRRFAVAGLDQAARRRGRRPLAVGALDETGQEKHGTATAGVQRQHMGCAGGVENGINTVHLSYVREGAGHALIGARQWIPAGQIADPVRSLVMGLPLDLEFRTKGQLAADLVADATADGVVMDFVCGDEVYGSCTQLRQALETGSQAYVLRVASSFRVTVAAGIILTCAEAVRRLGDRLRWEVRSAGNGSKGQRWYAWAQIGTASPRHCLLIRRHLRTGELAFHYCFVPEGQPAGMARLIRAAGLRWPVEEDFEFAKDCFGLDQSQVRLYHAIARHTVLVTAALAICAVTAALLRPDGEHAPVPDRAGQQPPPGLLLIPLTVPEIRRLLAAVAARLWPPGHVEHWSAWTRAHQARARWYHQRARLERDQQITMNPLVI
jgi:SRSO17 transposase